MLVRNSCSRQRIQIRASPQSIWRNTVWCAGEYANKSTDMLIFRPGGQTYNPHRPKDVLCFPYNFAPAYEEFCFGIYRIFAWISFIFSALYWDAKCDCFNRICNMIILIGFRPPERHYDGT